jgi:hypothetical protein
MSRKLKAAGKKRDHLEGEEDWLSPHWLREEVEELRSASRERKRLKWRERPREYESERRFEA